MNQTPPDALQLNDRAWSLCRELPRLAQTLRVQQLDDSGLAWDFGNAVAGGIEAGLFLARVCLADLADVSLVATDLPGTGFAVQVRSDHPEQACMHSQYAGWKIASDDYFAMGSGPMRLAASSEPLFESVPAEPCEFAVGVLESDKLPPLSLVEKLAASCGVPVDRLCLLAARTSSQAGNVQVVARSVETAMHKLMDLGVDLAQVESGAGIAPLPPVAENDLAGIGRTNDAILYGGRVTLWVRGDDADWKAIVDKVPSCASSDYGRPFAEVFAAYEYDFYKIDPHLFSPAVIRLINLDTGNSFTSGAINTEILAASCAS